MYLNGQVLSLLILQSNACKRKYTAVNKKFSYLVDNKYSFVKTKLHVCLSYNPRMAIKKNPISSSVYLTIQEWLLKIQFC